MVGESSTLDRFYVRVNISNKQQELRLIDYLCQGYRLTLKQKELLDHLRNMDSIIKVSMIIIHYIIVAFRKCVNL